MKQEMYEEGESIQSQNECIQVVAAIIQDGGRLLATQRGYGEWKHYWEFPGGKIEDGETPEVALKREMCEELAMEIYVDQLFCTVEYDYPKFHLIMYCYCCRVIGGGFVLLEHEAAKWLHVEELNSVEWLPADVMVVDRIKSC